MAQRALQARRSESRAVRAGREPRREVAEAPLTTTAVRRRKSQVIIDIDLGSGHRIRVDRDVDGDPLRRVLNALVRR